MLSYFFIPANRLSKIKEIKSLSVDNIIIDLEDSVKLSFCNTLIDEIISSYIDRTLFIRVPLYTLSNELDLGFYIRLKEAGFNNFVFPKIKDNVDFEIIASQISHEQQIIILIENPLMLIKLHTILEKFHVKINGVALGSHDFMSSINAKHIHQNLEYYRNFVLLLAKAYNLHALDIASMELEDSEKLKKEIIDGFNKGFDAKLYIHPWQIKVKDEVEFYKLSDLQWANKIYKEYLKANSFEEFEPIIVDGHIIEKPHLKKVFAIIKYFENYETK